MNTEGNIFERYKKFNGLEVNSPDTVTDTNRGSTTQPDVEDINRDNTMNTIDSYVEYKMNNTPVSLADLNNEFIVDRKEDQVSFPKGNSATTRWYQFRIPVSVLLSDFDNHAIPEYSRVGGITDFRSIRFARMNVNVFTKNRIMIFTSFDFVRSDSSW